MKDFIYLVPCSVHGWVIGEWWREDDLRYIGCCWACWRCWRLHWCWQCSRCFESWWCCRWNWSWWDQLGLRMSLSKSCVLGSSAICGSTMRH